MAKHCIERLSVLRWNDYPVTSFSNDLTRTIDIRHDARQAHGTRFEDHIREALAVTRKDKRVGRRILSQKLVTTFLAHHFNALSLSNYPLRFRHQRVKMRFICSYKHQTRFRNFVMQSAESLHQFVDPLITYQATHEEEGKSTDR